MDGRTHNASTSRLFIAALVALVVFVAPANSRGDEFGPVPGKSGLTDATQQAIAREKSTPIGPGGVSAALPARATGENAASSTSLVSMAAPLAVVVGVIFIAAAVFKKLAKGRGTLASSLGAGGSAPSGILEILGRYPVSRGQTLVLMRVDRRVLLLAHSSPSRGNPGGWSTLSEITDAEDVASILMKVSEHEGTGPSGKFEQMLKSFEDETPESGAARMMPRAEDSATMIQPDATIHPIEPRSGEENYNLRARLASLRGRAVGDAS